MPALIAAFAFSFSRSTTNTTLHNSQETPEAPAIASKKRAADDSEVPSKKAKTADVPSAAAASEVDPASADVTTVYVGGLSWNVDNEWLKSEMEVCGEVVSARVVTDRETSRSRGFGYTGRFSTLSLILIFFTLSFVLAYLPLTICSLFWKKY